jgi:hypothetical protein
LKTFESEAVEPTAQMHTLKRTDFRRARERGRRSGIDERGVATMEVGGTLHAQLRDDVSVGTFYGCVVIAHNMKNNGIVRGVAIVMVAMPIGCTHMNLNVARPFLSANYYLGVEEIGTGVGVETTGVKNLHPSTVYCGHAGRHPQAMLPNVLHQAFHGKCKETLNCREMQYPYNEINSLVT